MESQVKLSPPWISFYTKLEMLFREDEEVTVDFEDGEDRKIKIFVDNVSKAEALEKLLPKQKTFGNITVNIIVIPSNTADSQENLFRRAFEGNKSVNRIESVVPPYSSNPFTYILFKKEVVQYWDDNMADFYGYQSTLYQDIAKEVFGKNEDLPLDGIYFCTDDF